MSLIKRRSRSESRKFELHGEHEKGPRKLHSRYKLEHERGRSSQMDLHCLEQPMMDMLFMSKSSLRRRKTSAELISEAKSLLGGVKSMSTTNLSTRTVGGLRLVSTNRPITPREPGRALYGKVALPGRPPSAFSLRYLQNEGAIANRAPMTPTLEPIATPPPSITALTITATEKRLSRRSNSLNTHLDMLQMSGQLTNDCQSLSGKAVPRKLPSLDIKGHTSLDIEETMNESVEPRQTRNFMELQLLQPITKQKQRKSLPRNYGGSGGTGGTDLLAQSSTETLIELLKQHAGLRDCIMETVNHINAILVELYQRVIKKEKPFKRSHILGCLYGLVECTAPKILLAVARVVLALQVTGSNLTGACKLIFKVARNEINDHLFHGNDLLELLIDGLGHASPMDDPEACIYGYGSIRFLTSSTSQERTNEMSSIKDVNKNWSEELETPTKSQSLSIQAKPTNDTQQKAEQQKFSKQYCLVERLAKHGAIELMVLHLQILNEAGATKKLAGPPLHSLYQLSAALRAFADVQQTSNVNEEWKPKGDEAAADCGYVEKCLRLELACPHLIRAAEVSIGELEVQANIVRTLSVLSEDMDCCEAMSNFTARIGMLIGPCFEFFNSSSEKLLSLFSRLGYILGNIMAKYDEARIQFYQNDVAMEYLLNILQLYGKERLDLQNASGDTVLDVLVKMIRVVANMSVNAEVGSGLGNTRALGEILLAFLKQINDESNEKIQIELQELEHATLGALHNLCFYQDINITTTMAENLPQGSLQTILPELAVALYTALQRTTDDITQLETTRVLGNLTRNEEARKHFSSAGGLALVMEHLPHKMCQSYDLKACAIGILVNMLGDEENRVPFKDLRGDVTLEELLREALMREDWFMATIICQAFWNLLIDMSSVSEVCQDYVLDNVVDLLADFLDEEHMFQHSDSTIDFHWEEFAVVATDFLERVQIYYDQQCVEEEEEDEDDLSSTKTTSDDHEIEDHIQNKDNHDDDNDANDIFKNKL